MANYPGNQPQFTTKVDITDVVFAEHVNRLQNEVVAIAATLGDNVHIEPTPNAGTAFVATATTHGSLAERLSNIENGVISDSHTQYVKKVGGSTVTPSAIGVVGVVVQAMSGQTADLIQFKDSAGTTGVAVDKDANLVIDGASVPSVAAIEDLKGALFFGGNLGGL